MSRSMHLDNRRHPVKRAAALSTLTLLAATALGTTAGPAPALAADGHSTPGAATVAVTWAVATRVNPHVTPYEFTVTDNPTGAHLFYTWGWPDFDAWQIDPGTPVPDSGVATVDFGTAEGAGAVRVWTCPDVSWSINCTEAARSPQLDVWYDARVDEEQGTPEWRRSGVQHVTYWYGPKAPLGENHAGSWELLDADKQPLVPAVTGPLTDEDLAFDPDTGDSTLTFTIPDGLPSGTYYLDTHLSVDSVDYGHLEGSMGSGPGGPMEVLVDNDAPTLTVRKTPPVLYPVGDDYVDFFTVYAKASEWSKATLEVTNAHGDRVFRSLPSQLSDQDFNWNDAPSWDGRKGGTIVPEGRYRATLTVVDLAGNTTTWSTPFRVSHKHLQWTLFKRTVTAADSIYGKPYIGRCATLARPAQGGPRGSLGFYSATKCHGTLASAGVATNHGMYIPKAYKNHWDYAQVILNGGPATSAKGNYINLAYLRPNSRKLWNGKFFTKGNGAHKGLRYPIGASGVFGRSTDRPYIVWTNGATAGSRYDVRSYTVLVRYQALR
jgi:hypothetical protein